jgi:membrane protein DedA with SNARE-associated domain
MKITTFLLYTTLGAGVWNSVLAAIGYYLSTVPGIETEEQLLERVNEYSHELGMIIAAIVVIAIIAVVYKGLKKGKK